MPESFVDLHFPLAGVDLSAAYSRQPNRQVQEGLWARSAADGVNVRSFVDNRVRGGSRPGLTRYMSDQPEPGWINQNLNSIVSYGVGAVSNLSISGRDVQLINVTQGRVFWHSVGTRPKVWTEAQNNTGDTPPLNFDGILFSAPNVSNLWYADGINWVYYNPRDHTVNRWAATAGILPVDSDNNKPRLICTWRGRTVLSGLLKQPQNWFMSRVDDPTDFDYLLEDSDADYDPAAAIAGQNGPQGQNKDIVTALCPYSDDVLIFFGDHSIHLMNGDPAAGGQIDLVTDSIGATWGQSWCRDAYGNIYFFSNKQGVYRMVPGQQPVRISQQIEQLLEQIDTGTNIISLAYNDQLQTVEVYVTYALYPKATTHFVYELRTGSWWPMEFANPEHNPMAHVTVDGNEPGDRALVIGSWDGFVRSYDSAATKDDGYEIESSVTIGPLLTKDLDEVMIHELQAVLGEGSGDVEFDVLVASTAELAVESDPVFSGSWQGGRNLTDLIRRAGHACYVRLRSTDQWALEQIRVRMSTRGPVRRRGF